jgi:negative regulator of sigma-B (phosphoserine phosphatase)
MGQLIVPKSGAERLLEWGAACEAAPGEIVSGDGFLVHDYRGGILIGVVDGAGHGPAAASAAQDAIALLKRHAGEPIDVVLQRCHDGIRKSRGAAISLAAWDAAASLIVWSGVGNVEGAFLCRHDETRIPQETLLLRNGVVGYQFPSPRVATLPVHAGDLLVFVTDGIRSNFTDGIDWDSSVQAIADSLLSRHSRGSDDALALVVRFGNGAS